MDVRAPIGTTSQMYVFLLKRVKETNRKEIRKKWFNVAVSAEK
jgi:hypothetical protein